VSGIDTLKGNTHNQDGYALGQKWQDPCMRFLRSLGYTSFNYTDGKVVDAVEAHRCPMSSDLVVRDILFGNVEDVNAEDATSVHPSVMEMYS
jgi:hypothetical protein